MDVEGIARVCHNVNRAVCVAFLDESQVPWEEAPDWQQSSCIEGVKVALSDPHATPEQMHDNWRKTKVLNGWRWGPEKDVEKKTHPNLIAYERLPPEQRLKDFIFLAVVRSLQTELKEK